MDLETTHRHNPHRALEVLRVAGQDFEGTRHDLAVQQRLSELQQTEANDSLIKRQVHIDEAMI